MAAEEITNAELGRALLARQWLLRRQDATALQAAEQLIGMQAQEAKPPFLGLWSRLESFAREDLTRLLLDRQVVRATAMRCTIHLMSARDYQKFRATLQPALTGAMRSVLKDRVDETRMEANIAGAREFFADPATFDDLRQSLLKADPACDESAIAYIVRTQLPLIQVPTDAPWGFPSPTCFTLADSWLDDLPAVEVHRDDLALRYLAAFGPASVADFQTWSGLKAAKEIFERLRPNLQTFRDEKRRELFDLPDAPRPGADCEAPVRFLPEFDGVLLAHADRSRIIADEHRPRVVTKNLRVLATFLVNGVVAGTWTIERKKRAAVLVVKPFAALPAQAAEDLVAEGGRLLLFAERDADIRDVLISGY